MDVKNYVVEYTTIQTGAVVWTPTTGNRFMITDIAVSVSGTTAGTVTIFDEVNTLNQIIFKQEAAPTAAEPQRYNENFTTPYYSVGTNNSVRVTTSAAMTVRVHVRGFEE
jgi:hypothetical protein